MATVPVAPPLDRENGAVVVFAVGPDQDQPKTRELVERCRRYGSEPMILDATSDPLFAEHLKDPRMLAHFPLLCVRGGLVGNLDVVRQLDTQGQLRALLAPESSGGTPRIALGRSAADEFRRALVEPDQCIRVVVTEEFEHHLAVDTQKPGDIKAVLGDIPLVLDAQSAERADGLAIDWIETPDGHAFRIDNPNRPEPVQNVDRAWLEGEGRSLDLLVIDVRTRAEYATAHVEGARLLDAALIDALEQLDRNTALLFYCNGGIRSKRAAERYRELGFRNVYCLSEGIG